MDAIDGAKIQKTTPTASAKIELTNVAELNPFLTLSLSPAPIFCPVYVETAAPRDIKGCWTKVSILETTVNAVVNVAP